MQQEKKQRKILWFLTSAANESSGTSLASAAPLQ